MFKKTDNDSVSLYIRSVETYFKVHQTFWVHEGVNRFFTVHKKKLKFFNFIFKF